MKALVTGSAGFIGSHLVEELLHQGYEVVGIDSFEDYYPRPLKEANLAKALSHPAYSFVEGNLLTADLENILNGVDYVFHQAAQAGVRASWGKSFEVYVQNNILATQRLLEATKGSGIRKLVYASSSSVYGDTSDMPLRETGITQPVSPYGVSKLAAEHLCQLYTKNFQVPTVSLRYFTVYGPRQRPDMGFHKFMRAALLGQPIALYGDGTQTRDFTYVSDIVRANIAAATSPVAGEVFNIGGGARVSLMHVFDVIGKLTGSELDLRREGFQSGDVMHTWADLSKAERLLNYHPTVSLEEGLTHMVSWARQIYPDKP